MHFVHFAFCAWVNAFKLKNFACSCLNFFLKTWNKCQPWLLFHVEMLFRNWNIKLSHWTLFSTQLTTQWYLLYAYFLERKIYYLSLITELELRIGNICLDLDQVFLRFRVFNSFCEWKNFESFLHPKSSSVLLISLSQLCFQFEVLSALSNFLCFKLTGNIRQSPSAENFNKKLILKKVFFFRKNFLRQPQRSSFPGITETKNQFWKRFASQSL